MSISRVLPSGRFICWKLLTFLFSSLAEYSGMHSFKSHFNTVMSSRKSQNLPLLGLLWLGTLIGGLVSSSSRKSSRKLNSSGDESTSAFKSWISLRCGSRFRNFGDDDDCWRRSWWGLELTRATVWKDGHTSAWYCEMSGSESLRKSLRSCWIESKRTKLLTKICINGLVATSEYLKTSCLVLKKLYYIFLRTDYACHQLWF